MMIRLELPQPRWQHTTTALIVRKSKNIWKSNSEIHSARSHSVHWNHRTPTLASIYTSSGSVALLLTNQAKPWYHSYCKKEFCISLVIHQSLNTQDRHKRVLHQGANVAGFIWQTTPMQSWILEKAARETTSAINENTPISSFHGRNRCISLPWTP